VRRTLVASGRWLAAGSLLLLAVLAGPPTRAADGWRLSCLDNEAPLTDADLSRGTTIVVVWATWSPRSSDVVQRTNGLVKRWGASARVAMVDFQEEQAEVEAFLEGKGALAPVCLDPDGAFSKRYQMATLPGLLVVRDGQVAYRGKLPDDPDKVIAELP
jgi:hypothetical protein